MHMASLSPIPQPPTIPFLGNATLIDLEVPLRSFVLLSKQYGEIYQLSFSGGSIVIHVNSAAMVRQVSNDAIFKKSVSRSLREARILVGDGLFTADNEEPNWGIAHRILLPAFGSNIRSMFPDMQDICSQMLLKWSRFGPQHVFDPSDDYTRLTFDIIALCSMSFRFNSFYERDKPAFTQEMAEFLSMSSRRVYRPPFSRMLPLYYRKEDEKYLEYAERMTNVAKEILRQRQEHPSDKKDLLTLMLEGKDPKTEERLSEDNIIYNLLTFLIAGHETTGGMLTFATYYLLKNPSCLGKLREELDEVLGTHEPTLEDLGKMPYLMAVIRETLRLWPTVPARTVVPNQDSELVGGDGNPTNQANKRYAIKKGQLIMLHGITCQRDPLVWGDDAEAFRPERMLDGKFENLPKHSWQPFGYGGRSCIGRSFAIQEALLVLASAFNNFDIYLNDPSYTLEIKQTLTIKPKDMFIRVMPRQRTAPMMRPLKPHAACNKSRYRMTEADRATPDGNPLLVLYGSNTGTAQTFAERIAFDSCVHGYKAQIMTLDNAIGCLPTSAPVVIVTASFEGEPADNAAQFVTWLSSLKTERKESSLQGVSYTIFGCGNREWARIFQRIPRLIDEKMADAGAHRLLDRGEGDAASPDFFQKFEDFEERMWNTLRKNYNVATKENDANDTWLDIELSKPDSIRKTALRISDAEPGEILINRILTKPGVPEKRHIEIKIPEGMSYKAGDYLAILPRNPPETVRRVMNRFRLNGDQEITIKSTRLTSLPIDTPVTVYALLSGFVELSQPATTRDLLILKTEASNENTVAALNAFLDKHYEIVAKRISMLDLLEQYDDITLPFVKFLCLLPPMRVRQYSISSSPLANPSRVSLTVGVIEGPALSGAADRRFRGVASTFLANLKDGDHVSVVVRPSAAHFSLPPDPSTPIIMFAAGSGLAPFRGFIQERALQKSAGRVVGPTILFFGCRDPDLDYLYMDSELQEWADMGVFDAYPAFSRKSERSEGCKYVQHRMWHERRVIAALHDSGLKYYVCGSRRIASGVKQMCIDIMKDCHPDWTDEQMATTWDNIQKERYATDIFD